MDYQAALTRVIDDAVTPNAAEIDRTGAFPRANLDALGKAASSASARRARWAAAAKACGQAPP